MSRGAPSYAEISRQNSSAFWDHEREQLLQRTKAAQRLQGCSRVRGGRVAADSGGVDFLAGFRRAAMGDEDIHYRRYLRLSGGADFFLGG